MEQIAALEQPILESIGITKIGHINRLQKAVESLRGRLVSMELGQQLAVDAADGPLRSHPQILLDESEQPTLVKSMTLSDSARAAAKVPPIPARRSFQNRSPSPTAGTSSSSTSALSASLAPVPAPRNKVAPPTIVPRTRVQKQTTDVPPATSTTHETSPTHTTIGKCDSLPVQGFHEKKKPPSPKPRHRPTPATLTSLAQPSSSNAVASSSPPKISTTFLEDVSTSASSIERQLPSSSEMVTCALPSDNQLILPKELPGDVANVTAVTVVPPVPSAQVDVQKLGSAPPPPVRTSSRRRDPSEPGRGTVAKTVETDSTATLSSTVHQVSKESSEEVNPLPHLVSPSFSTPVIPSDGYCAGLPPELPPKDVSLSDLPDHVMPRISSIDVLLSSEVSAKGVQSSDDDANKSTVSEDISLDVFVSPQEFSAPLVQTTSVDIFTPLPSPPAIEDVISSIAGGPAMAPMLQDNLLENVPSNSPPPPPPRTPRLSIPDFTAPLPPMTDDSENEEDSSPTATPSLNFPPPSHSAPDLGSESLEDSSRTLSVQGEGAPSSGSSLSDDGFASKDTDGGTLRSQARQLPPLPPKDVPNFSPPPPPPITDEDFPSGYSSDSGSSFAEGPRMVIMSSFSRQSTKGIIPLSLKHSPMSDDVDECLSNPLSPLSSVCSDTEKGLVTIVQQNSLRHDDIIDMDFPRKKSKLTHTHTHSALYTLPVAYPCHSALIDLTCSFTLVCGVQAFLYPLSTQRVTTCTPFVEKEFELFV